MYVFLPDTGLWTVTDLVDLSDILPTSYHAIEDTKVEKGDIVGVWG